MTKKPQLFGWPVQGRRDGRDGAAAGDDGEGKGTGDRDWAVGMTCLFLGHARCPHPAVASIANPLLVVEGTVVRCTEYSVVTGKDWRWRGRAPP